VECTIRWTGEGMTLIAETGSNHVLAMDGAPDGGGRNLAPRPMETVLAGTGDAPPTTSSSFSRRAARTLPAARCA